ncbi:MFS transporter [Brevibacillus fluminis]|uniref:MFS transporter n=1 Tax=Brevibacillus fluminis TaxID=511487 RepID=UPI003F8B641A
MAGNKHPFIILAILAGTFLVPVNSTMIAVGLPSISQSLGSGLASSSWIITVYLIVMTVLQPIAGKLGDLYGNRRMFLLGMFLFLLSSTACIFSTNLLWLISFRAVQAVGGALASPNASAILRFVTPRERLGKAFGVFGLTMGLGAAIGPLVGSLLISQWGWTSIFWINLPFALFSLLASFVLLPKRTPTVRAALDWVGSALLAVSLVTLILVVSHPAFLSVWTIVLFGLSTALFIVQERRSGAPLIEFALFRNRMFTSANLSILLSNAVMYSTILIMPILLQTELLFPVTTIGMLLFVFSLASSLCSFAGGHLESRLGKKRTVLLSFLFSALGALAYLGISMTHSLAYLYLAMAIGGIGAGIGMASMQTASLTSVPKEMSGIASGIFSTFRYVGGMIASVLVSLSIGHGLLFSLLLLFALVGVPVSFGLGDGIEPGHAAKQKNVGA